MQDLWWLGPGLRDSSGRTLNSRKSKHMYRDWGGTLEEPQEVKTWKQERRSRSPAETQKPVLQAASLLRHSNSSQTGILQHLIKVPLECMSKFLRSRSGRSQQLPRQSRGMKIMTAQEQAGADCLRAEGIVLLWQSCDNLKWTLPLWSLIYVSVWKSECTPNAALFQESSPCKSHRQPPSTHTNFFALERVGGALRIVTWKLKGFQDEEREQRGAQWVWHTRDISSWHEFE